MKSRRSLSLHAHAVERVDDLIRTLVEDYTESKGVSRADIVSALIYAAPIEPASLSRLVRFGRMERFADEGDGLRPDSLAYEQCLHTAHALGWREP